jgi:hypothetical protein
MPLIWRLPNNVSGLWNSTRTACAATGLTQLPEATNQNARRARAKSPTTSRKKARCPVTSANRQPIVVLDPICRLMSPNTLN